jgi:uncharacterized membrane protein YjfL (UPF0719 family)
MFADFFPPDYWHSLVLGIIASLAYGCVGIFLVLFGFKLLDWLTPKIHIQNELIQKNVPVAIVISSMILGVCYLVAQVVSK